MERKKFSLNKDMAAVVHFIIDQYPDKLYDYNNQSREELCRILGFSKNKMDVALSNIVAHGMFDWNKENPHFIPFDPLPEFEVIENKPKKPTPQPMEPEPDELPVNTIRKVTREQRVFCTHCKREVDRDYYYLLKIPFLIPNPQSVTGYMISATCSGWCAFMDRDRLVRWQMREKLKEHGDVDDFLDFVCHGMTHEYPDWVKAFYDLEYDRLQETIPMDELHDATHEKYSYQPRVKN